MRARLRRAIRALGILAACAALGLAVRAWGFGLVRISGTSMNDTVRSGDIVLVTRFDYRLGGSPAFGDIVECRFEGRSHTYVKRVVGLPGEVIAFEGGALYRDGSALSEPYVSSATEDYRITLGEDEYLVLGDNRRESYDSRMEDMGPIGADGFVGRVRMIVWPASRFGAVY